MSRKIRISRCGPHLFYRFLFYSIIIYCCYKIQSHKTITLILKIFTCKIRKGNFLIIYLSNKCSVNILNQLHVFYIDRYNGSGNLTRNDYRLKFYKKHLSMHSFLNIKLRNYILLITFIKNYQSVSLIQIFLINKKIKKIKIMK